MQNLNRSATSGIPRRYDARDFKLMHPVTLFGPAVRMLDPSATEVNLALQALGLPKMSAGPGRLDIE